MSTITSLKLSDIEKMTDISIEDTIDFNLDENQKKHLSPKAHEILSRESIRKVIRDFGEDGLSRDEIAEATNLDRNTVKKHLDKLIGLREVYAQKRNKKLTLYYHNGRPLHQLGKKRLDYGNPILEITIAQGRKNAHFFYILEKRYSILEGEVPEGGIMIPIDELDEVIEALRELKQNYGEYTNEN